MTRVLFFFLLMFSFQAYAQYNSGVTYPDPSIEIISDLSLPNLNYGNQVTKEGIAKHLTILASDEYEGRETGAEGNNKAAEYIANHFESIGLESKNDSYFQDVAFTYTTWDSTSLYVNEKKYKHLWDYLSFPTLNSHQANFTTDQVLFLGYGIADKRYSDYRGTKVKGKTIMIYEGEPTTENNISQVTKTENLSGWTTEKKLEYAKKKGVKMVLIIEDNIKQRLSENRRNLLGGSMELGDKTKMENTLADHIYISSSIAQEVMGSKKSKVIKSRDKSKLKGKSRDVKLKSKLRISLAKNENVIKSQNVYGFIPGSDKSDELIVVSAHFDHLGKKGKDIFNGADDNGSGTSTVLEMATAFQKAHEQGQSPKRSILFLLVTGEEKGLLGSEYYANQPLFPLENTVADVNIDMIGRVDEKHEEDPNYIYVIGSDRLSSDLHDINEELNQKYSQLQLDYTYNDENDPNRYYYRSDHYNFAKNGIPSIFFFSGVHKDYHRPSDTVEKIMFPKMEKIARHAFQLVWELANREERIEVDGEEDRP